MKYRKKPVVVEAIQYDGLNNHEIKVFCEGKAEIIINDAAWEVGKGTPFVTIYLPTKEGKMEVSKGDYVIKEPFATDDRKFYPCKPDIFEKTYEKVE